MKQSTYLLAALLAAGFIGSAHAQAPSASDLFLGFDTSSGTGSGTNLEVDLGSVGAYVSAGAGTYTIANLGTDLTATYGSGWATSSTLLYGVAGAAGQTTAGPNGQAAKTLWASSSEATIGTPGVAYAQKAASFSTSPTNLITSVGANMGSGTSLSDINSQTNAFGASLIGATLATGTTGSWSQASGAPAGGTGFAMSQYNAPGLSLQGVAGTGTLDLYQILPGSGSAHDLGTFSLDSSGVLSFTVGGSPIPEPSTYAAILGAAALGFVMLRRRTQVSSFE